MVRCTPIPGEETTVGKIEVEEEGRREIICRDREKKNVANVDHGKVSVPVKSREDRPEGEGDEAVVVYVGVGRKKNTVSLLRKKVVDH